MRTLLFTLEYPPFKGGVAKYNGNIFEFWPEPEQIFVLNNNENALLTKNIYPHWLPAVRALYREIKSKKIDQVLVGEILPLGTAALILKLFLRFDYTILLHGTDLQYAKKNWRKRILARLILKRAKCIIGNSSYVKKLAQKFVPQETPKISRVNPGVLRPLSRDLMGEVGLIKALRRKYDLNNKFVIFSLGRLVKRKGIDKMLEAMPIILERVEEARFFIAGVGPDEGYLKNIYSDLDKKVREKIVFLGKVSEAEKWAWLKMCDTFAMASRDVEGDVEGFGIVYLEANLCGKPIVAGRGGGASDAVVDYENGIMVDPESSDDLAESVIELYQKPMLRLDLGENGLRRALEKFTPQKQANKIFKIINNS